jgi:hypothetical protein
MLNVKLVKSITHGVPWAQGPTCESLVGLLLSAILGPNGPHHRLYRRFQPLLLRP